MVTIAAVCLAFAAPARGEVTIALVPRGTGVGELAALGLAPGLMSAGLGSVPAAQTYLDISQGNRVFDSLYDSDLGSDLGGGMCGPAYSRTVVERAESAPAEIVPGLLAATLARAGERCAVVSVSPRGLAGLIRGLRGDDLLIAIERAPPPDDEALAIGIGGRRFAAGLTSDSTRTEGYVLSTDVAPTILAGLGLAIPDQMSGQPISSAEEVDVAAIESLGKRMAAIPGRRGPVIGFTLLAWALLAGAALAVTRGSAARPALQLLALSLVYLPLVLLVGAAAEPGQGAERALLMLGAPALAGLTLGALRGYRALALASGLVVIAYALDVMTGSSLTSLSLLGPNPGLGVRFYGIGNELEAILAVLVVGGSGAALSGFVPRIAPTRAAVAFLATGLACAAVFAAGRFGADVGAAIVLPVGAAVAAATVAAWRRRWVLVSLAAPLVLLALIALLDLASGANAHLTRSVLDAGGLDRLAEVAQRRLQLSAHSFVRPVVLACLPVVAALGVLAIVCRDTLLRWVRDAPAMGAGLAGALAAVVCGTLANDSGALLLVIGAVYLAVLVAVAWTEQPSRPSVRR